MVKIGSLAFVGVPTILASGSVRYDAETHVPRTSVGCGKASPYAPGSTTPAQATYGGHTYKYRVYVPKNYNKNTPTPLVIQHHGWGMTAQSEQSGSGIADYADAHGYIAVHPQGLGDNTHSGGPWFSWNAVGSTQSPGPGGATCTSKADWPSYCYTSCAPCRDSPQCDWTTCENEVTPTGTGYSNVNGFIPSLYDTLESQLCIDTTREYVAGESNGGMMAYQVAVNMADRLAAAAPQFGSFHKGFTMAPKTGVPIIDIHGRQDTTVPANKSLSGDGYYYTTVSDMFNGDKYSSGWKKANGCSGPITNYKTNYDGKKGLSCVSEGKCSGGDVVRCAWNGGHNWYGNSATLNGGLVSDFLVQWTKPTHIGFGKTVGEKLGEPDLLQDITIIDEEEPPQELGAHLPVTMTASATGHYGNPRDGCLEGEKVVPLGTGHACALDVPKKNGDIMPDCKLGGVLPVENNGCPHDARVSANSKSYPLCIAKNEGDQPYDDGDFVCVLTCPCEVLKRLEDGSVECADESHTHCPEGARCERGEMRHMSTGVCTYPTEASIFA